MAGLLNLNPNFNKTAAARKMLIWIYAKETSQVGYRPIINKCAFDIGQVFQWNTQGLFANPVSVFTSPSAVSVSDYHRWAGLSTPVHLGGVRCDCWQWNSPLCANGVCSCNNTLYKCCPLDTTHMIGNIVLWKCFLWGVWTSRSTGAVK